MSPNTLALVFVTLVASACSSAQSSPSLTQGQTPRGCPLGVTGANVVAEDTSDGIALSFRTTDKSKIAEMRERANDAAAQHGPGQRLGLGHEGKHAEGGEHGLKMMQGPAARAIADDIEGGARIRFVPADPADADALRAKLRERAATMNDLACK